MSILPSADEVADLDREIDDNASATRFVGGVVLAIAAAVASGWLLLEAGLGLISTFFTAWFISNICFLGALALGTRLRNSSRSSDPAFEDEFNRLSADERRLRSLTAHAGLRGGADAGRHPSRSAVRLLRSTQWRGKLGR